MNLTPGVNGLYQVTYVFHESDMAYLFSLVTMIAYFELYASILGTPIQNNLTELWALLKWLNVEPYATHRPLYKRQIEHAVKHGHPHGLQRLQTLMQLICLRRTKSDQVINSAKKSKIG